jgi:hypothetical protein
VGAVADLQAGTIFKIDPPTGAVNPADPPEGGLLVSIDQLLDEALLVLLFFPGAQFWPLPWPSQAVTISDGLELSYATRNIMRQ